MCGLIDMRIDGNEKNELIDPKSNSSFFLILYLGLLITPLYCKSTDQIIQGR